MVPLDRRLAALSLTMVGVLGLAACAGSSGADAGSSQAPQSSSASNSSSSSADPAAPSADSGIVSVGLAAPYTPSSSGTSTDDYRCFVLATDLPSDRFITGVRFVPDNAAIVHHAILYRVAPSQVDAALARDAKDEGDGWSCFGGPDLPPAADGDAVSSLDTAPWLAAWAPGGREARYPEGTGVFIEAGSSVIMQVHYNLLGGTGGDATAVELRTVPGDSDLRRLETMLLPAPVELPCRDDESGPLCDRGAAVKDTIERFGGESLRTIWGLQFLCGGDLVEPKASATQSCTHTVKKDLTVYAAAGHMHLLGRTISVVANEGDADQLTLLDVKEWDFDNQGAIPLPEPVTLVAGDTLTVKCTHDTGLRGLLPALADAEPRYITWGDGTTDEMCLGILTISEGAGSGPAA